MCPPADAPVTNGQEDMVPIDNSNMPHLPPSTNETNGVSAPPPVKSHKGLYARPADFLSNTSNWQVGFGSTISLGSAWLINRLSSLPSEVR